MVPEFLSQRVTRRQFTLGSTVGAVALTFMPARTIFAAAQDTSDFSSLGYPELAITITDTGFEGAPATTVAGRYLLKAINKTTSATENAGGVGLLSPTPAGLSTDDFLQLLAAAPGPSENASPVSESTPVDSATPAASDDQSQQVPLVVYQMYFAGGVFTLAGQTAEAVIDLPAGEYVIWGDDPSVPQKPVVMTVTGDFPQEVKDPVSDITATLVDFAITLEGTLTAGKHIIKVQHHGAQPHFLDIEKGPDTMTKEQVMTAFKSDPSATPVAGGLKEGDLQPAFYSPTQSIGTVTYQHIELPAGTYLAACFFATAGTGVPHAFNGMIDVFKVTG